ncbi:hypothetical protein TWF281_008980 [Arthrobotrys megalospora]
MPRCYKAQTSEVRYSIHKRSEEALDVIASSSPSRCNSKYKDWWAGYRSLIIHHRRFSRIHRSRFGVALFFGSEILSGHTLLWQEDDSEKVPFEGHMEDVLDVGGFKF